MRAAVRDLDDLAACRRVPLFRLYWSISGWEGERAWHSYTRTGLRCVVAFGWEEQNHEFGPYGLAVATDCSFFWTVQLVGNYERQGGKFRDQRAVYARKDHADPYTQLTGRYGAGNTDLYMRQLVAAASALMAPVELGDGKRTGIQPDGWIGYWE
ncbi:hypothetical protein ACIQWZ_40120 [Streptomyces sp. NPDC098077]|uniref:hypothetical protein n=1 Tax=Streptomyces sp. NPDC098077 TaxID=3366093 RepID=UPI0038075C8E